jgi:outer membrane protein OmpA-like peptidoglycan-associated protein
MVTGGPLTARADGWMVAEAPAAVEISDAEAGLHGGVMPAIGLYADRGTVALGFRVRVGVLRDAVDGRGAPGYRGVGTGGVALRLAGDGPWIEGVAGGGIVGHDFVPALEAGAGWNFTLDSVDLGPSARYVHLAGATQMPGDGGADLLLLGIDVRFSSGRPHAAPPSSAPVQRVAFVPPPVQPFPEPAPVAQAPSLRGDCASDSDGCDRADPAVTADEHVVLENRVQFDVDRAAVGASGRAQIREILRMWREHPEWRRMSIEGHADVRGSDEYNLELSRNRAARVRDVVVELGGDPERIDVVGHGRSRPIDPGTSEAAHRRNRRVEFVLERAPSGSSD